MARRALLACSALAATLLIAPAARANDWQFSVTPYLWLAGLDGKFANTSALPTIHVDESFGDILDTVQFAFTGKFEARHGPFGLLGDIEYTDVGAHQDLTGSFFSHAEIGSKTVIGAGAIAYRFFEYGGASADVLAGARVTWANTDITLGDAGGDVASTSTDKTWGDAYIGVRGVLPVSAHWSLSGYGDIGAGYSDYTWQAYAAANYTFSNGVVLSGGYRVYDDDYDDDGYIYDVTESGFLLGGTFNF
ncbi:MAG: hypothetical protein ABUS48_01505 [Pseudomonadota bacterium]